MTYLTWFADVLRAASLNVVEQPGWKTRGKAWPGSVKGIICHHTAGPKTGNAPSLKVVTDGRRAFRLNGRDYPAVSGPLSQVVLGRDGTWFLVAAGRANHAGIGAWKGITAGSSNLIGIEAENMGTPEDPWPEVQIASYALGVAALLKRFGLSADDCIGHLEWALPKGRKIDPTFNMSAFRARVAQAIVALSGGKAPKRPAPVPSVDPRSAMLRKGSTGESVRVLQAKLGITVDGKFGPKTEAAVKAYQAAHNLTVDGDVGPKTWAALLA
jgi:N-acetylmuramoyl-L-alanine amidase/Putative peptidoglycan binding domain